MKASMGRVPLWPGCRDERLPGASGWESIEHIGPITRDVQDSALMLSVIAGPDPRDRWSLPAGDLNWVAAAQSEPRRGLRVAYWPQWPKRPIDPGVRAGVDRAIAAFANAYGHEVEIGEPPPIDIAPAFRAIVTLATDLTGLRSLVAAKGEAVTPALSKLLAQRLPIETVTDAMTTRKAFANAMARIMDRFDLLITPTTPTPAYAAESDSPDEIDGRPVGPDDWNPFTFPFNLTGQPAASVPRVLVGGLPVGLQIVGPHLGDATIINAAAAFERAIPSRIFAR